MLHGRGRASVEGLQSSPPKRFVEGFMAAFFEHMVAGEAGLTIATRRVEIANLGACICCGFLASRPAGTRAQQ